MREAYATFFCVYTFREEHRSGSLTRKTYSVRGYGGSDVMASVWSILTEHPFLTPCPHPDHLFGQLRPLLVCPRRFHITVTILLPTDDQTNVQAPSRAYLLPARYHGEDTPCNHASVSEAQREEW